MNNLLAWFRGFVPAPILGARRERIIACIGACIGLLFTESLSRAMFGEINPWFIAPMGASAVLLFAVPASPLAQPWSIIGGNLFSALIGVTCARWIDNPAQAAAIAGALAIAAMFSLRCLHPPSGAVALTAVLGGPAVKSLGYQFVISPVALNSAFLLLTALVFNNLLRRRYPHQAHQTGNKHGTADLRPVERLGFTRADLDAAVKAYDELLDVNEDDLEEIFRQAELRAYSRRTGEVRCADIMSKDIVIAHPKMTPAQVWQLLTRHSLHALPVVNDSREVIGIVTLRDLVTAPEGGAARVRKEGTVRDIMTSRVHFARPEHTVVELVPLFSDEGFHHLPVVDERRRLLGMVTQSDLVAALYRKTLEELGKAA
jgi:CBS domain-containing membrane protein